MVISKSWNVIFCSVVGSGTWQKRKFEPTTKTRWCQKIYLRTPFDTKTRTSIPQKTIPVRQTFISLFRSNTLHWVVWQNPRWNFVNGESQQIWQKTCFLFFHQQLLEQTKIVLCLTKWMQQCIVGMQVYNKNKENEKQKTTNKNNFEKKDEKKYHIHLRFLCFI